MTKIIKVNCDKWWNRVGKCLFISAIIGWGLITIGLVYSEYYFITWSYPLLIFPTDWGIFYFVAIIIGLANTINLYFVSRTIYRNQKLVKFECVSGEE